jgi:hypothetical protein
VAPECVKTRKGVISEAGRSGVKEIVLRENSLVPENLLCATVPLRRVYDKRVGE